MQVRNEVKELRLLFEVLQILDSASDLSDNLETVLEVMAEHTGMMRGVITLLDEAHGEIAIEAAYGMSAEAQSKGRYKLGEGITGKVIESGKPLVIPNVLVEPLFLNRTGKPQPQRGRFLHLRARQDGRPGHRRAVRRQAVRGFRSARRGHAPFERAGFADFQGREEPGRSATGCWRKTGACWTSCGNGPARKCSWGARRGCGPS